MPGGSWNGGVVHNDNNKSRGGGGGGGGGGVVGQDHVNPEFADSALLLPLNLYGEKRRPFCWANKTCRALL